jgi:hypothetical protein
MQCVFKTVFAATHGKGLQGIPSTVEWEENIII